LTRSRMAASKMHRLTRITPPAVRPLSLDEARDHLRVTQNAEDALISMLIETAEAWLDGWRGVLGLALEPQTWELSLDRFPAGAFCIPLGPVVSVTSVSYVDAEGAEQVLAPAEYEADGERVRPVGGWPSTGPTMGAVKIRFVAGEGTPENIKHVVRLLIGHWYTNRESVGDRLEAMPMGVNMLIDTVRVVRI